VVLALAVLTAGAAAWWLLTREAEPPPHPLARIEAADFVMVEALSPAGAQQFGGERLRHAATAIASLKTAPRIDSRAVTWGSATMLRAITADGIAVSLQVKPVAGGAAVRVTADPVGKGAAPDAAAIRTLRLNAYKLGPEAADALLQR
jgi:hypothetical protein